MKSISKYKYYQYYFLCIKQNMEIKTHQTTKKKYNYKLSVSILHI